MAAIAALLAVVGLGVAGCADEYSWESCPDSDFIVAVAADAAAPGTIYVADARVTGQPFTIARASTWAPLWSAPSDGTRLDVLAPASGGVIVVNGGAAARRFDTSGTLLWTIGYGAFVGVRATLTSTDRLAVVDRGGVRMFAPDGAPVSERALPAQRVHKVISDRADGVWMLGDFPSGTLVQHLDASGALVGSAEISGDAEYTDLAMTVDPDGVPMLVVRHGAPSSPPTIDAFDRTGGQLWSHVAPVGRLVADGTGALLVLSGNLNRLTVARWAPSGGSAPVSFAIDDHEAGGFTIATTPLTDGILVAGQRFNIEADYYASCPISHYLLQVTTANLAVVRLTLGLP